MSIEGARTIGDGASEELEEAIAALMSRAAPRIVSQLSLLDVEPGGRIRPTVENVRRVDAILDQVAAVLFDEQYLEAVAEYLESLNEVSSAVTEGMAEFGADQDLMTAIAKRTKTAAAAALLSTSSFRELFGAISAQLINGIASGAELALVADGIRQAIES